MKLTFYVELQQKTTALQKVFAGKKLIIARDRAEQNNGVIQKLKAVEKLLANYPDWQGNVVYLQICEPIDDNSPSEMAISTQVHEYGIIHGCQFQLTFM